MMKKQWMILILVVSMLLSGCTVYNQTYVHIEPHEKETGADASEVVSARDYDQLIEALDHMVTYGREGGLIYISEYDQAMVEQNMRSAEVYIRQDHPVGAYSVEDITYEVGVSSGKPAISVAFDYRHSPMEIRLIRKLPNMGSVRSSVGGALLDYDPSLVVYVSEYEEMDFAQMVKDYVETFPDAVMEVPQVTTGVFGARRDRVIELTFTYQTNRDSLREMQEQVEPVFDSAALYVSGEGSDRQKLSQLFGFLMERFDYTVETSITPTYSLLRHGVGDSRAFAVVYAAMCRQAGMECMVVTGTKNGDPWSWNIVRDDGNYYHVDLLRSSHQGNFREYLDSDMDGYVWDYSAYPACRTSYVAPAQPQPSEPSDEATEEPQETAASSEPTETQEATQPSEVPAEEKTENLE